MMKTTSWTIAACIGLAAAGSAEESQKQLATFGAGCFWCTEAVFERLPGVSDVKVGYMGGKVENPTYRQVCTGETGHAEVMQLRFDPTLTSYHDLLILFFQMHDPTTLNRQGADVGTQYRSVIFTHNDGQKKTAEALKRKLDRSGDYENPIVTEISPASTFYVAEDYHQDYFEENGEAPYCRFVIAPKLKKLGLEE